MRLTNDNSTVIGDIVPLKDIAIDFDDHNTVYKCDIVKRVKKMSLHGVLLDGPDGNLIKVDLNETVMEVYCLRVRRFTWGQYTGAHGDFLVGTSKSDVIRAHKLLSLNQVPFFNIEGMLEEEGLPNPKDFDRMARVLLKRHARVSGIADLRHNRDIATVELSEKPNIVKELEHCSNF